MDLDPRGMAEAAAVACAARSPPGRAAIVFVQNAATNFRIPLGGPVINRLVQNAGQQWPDNNFRDQGALRCQVETEQALREWAQ